MSKINTGSPAFPNSDASYIHRIGVAAMTGIEDADLRDLAYTQATAVAAQGMTLRDYLAAKAMLKAREAA